MRAGSLFSPARVPVRATFLPSADRATRWHRTQEVLWDSPSWHFQAGAEDISVPFSFCHIGIGHYLHKVKRECGSKKIAAKERASDRDYRYALCRPGLSDQDPESASSPPEVAPRHIRSSSSEKAPLGHFHQLLVKRIQVSVFLREHGN